VAQHERTHHIGRLDLLPKLYQTIAITAEVYDEVVVRGAGLAGSTEIAASQWVNIKRVQNATDLPVAQQKYGLGIGEISAIIFKQGSERRLA
jgi:predicted nucleic acid-binding protein